MTDPVDFLLRAAMHLPRPEIERLAEELIGALDALDGDSDVELNGDEADTIGDDRDYSVNERIDQAEPIVGTGNDQFRPGTRRMPKTTILPVAWPRTIGGRRLPLDILYGGRSASTRARDGASVSRSGRR